MIYCIYEIYTIYSRPVNFAKECRFSHGSCRPPRNERHKGSFMNIIITNTGGVPIYEQIASRIKGMILNGRLKEGDALPSMRALAQDLRVSVITTKRAYEILESEGFIQSFTGRGSFVSAADPEMLKEQNLREIEEYLGKAAEIAKRSGVSSDELCDILKLLFE